MFITTPVLTCRTKTQFSIPGCTLHLLKLLLYVPHTLICTEIPAQHTAGKPPNNPVSFPYVAPRHKALVMQQRPSMKSMQTGQIVIMLESPCVFHVATNELGGQHAVWHRPTLILICNGLNELYNPISQHVIIIEFNWTPTKLE